MIQSPLPSKVGWSFFSLLKRVYCKVKLGIIPKYEKPRIGCHEQEAHGEINAPRKASPVLPECHGRASVLIPVSRGNRRMPRKLECGSCLEARQAAAACPSPDAPPETPREPPLLQTSLWEGGASSQVAASENSYPPPSLAASPAL